ncbi:uncharacterized protein B0H18DRAFT_1130675 [Fomitopsis serialis]|uniref:uncharacterized protein n=1 Tax=Fomitopsis serialis TaxID=139415 RepID=UPI002008C7D4|nr:uncharacterized protein B0H18DRAFT_1130675 [Neoantrodia serialis]KAH9910152.1 hypothetical protein B0H18DRAFT_1130675 [Neoantrodia serialis]
MPVDSIVLDSRVRAVRNIQFTAQDLKVLLPHTQHKVGGTVLNAFGAYLQDFRVAATEESNYCILSSWVPALVGGTVSEGPSSGSFDTHMSAAGGKDVIRAKHRWALPMCGGSPAHWVLGYVDFSIREAGIYDSLPQVQSNLWAKPLLHDVLNKIIKYINRDAFLSIDETWTFAVKSPPESSRQSDAWSCGIFTLLALQHFASVDDSYTTKDDISIEVTKTHILGCLMTLPLLEPVVDVEPLDHLGDAPLDCLGDAPLDHLGDAPPDRRLGDAPLDHLGDAPLGLYDNNSSHMPKGDQNPSTMTSQALPEESESNHLEAPTLTEPPGIHLAGEEHADTDGVFWLTETGLDNRTKWVRMKRCTLCGMAINLGSGVSLHAYNTHFDKAPCRDAVAKQRKESGLKKQRKLMDMFCGPSRATSTSSPSPLATSPPLAAPSTDPATMASRSEPGTGSPDSEPADMPVQESHAEITAMFRAATICPGILLEFPMPFERTYPFHLHAFDNLPYTLSHWDRLGGLLNSNRTLERMRARATEPVPTSLNWRYYNFNQFTEAMDRKNDEKNTLKLQNLNLAKQYERATTRLSDHERFKGILAQGDVEGADRLVRVAMQNHRSISEIVARMSRAACGLYQAKSFQDKNYDVMALAGALGGPKLQYAMAEALGLPAISTTSSRSRLPSLEASIGFPRLSEYAHNLLVLHNAGLLHGTSSGSGQTRRRGWQAMIDEIALEERPRYDSRRDAILGIARETSHEVDITTVTLETLHGAADALNDGSLALAKEATFVGLAAYGRDDYTVLPVMISGTNKTERDHSQARWIQLAIDAWDAPIPDLNTTYEEQYGELWALGSDGDATRRRALHYY